MVFVYKNCVCVFSICLHTYIYTIMYISMYILIRIRIHTYNFNYILLELQMSTILRIYITNVVVLICPLLFALEIRENLNLWFWPFSYYFRFCLTLFLSEKLRETQEEAESLRNKVTEANKKATDLEAKYSKIKEESEKKL